ncbi:unnamed protein product [Boreogadus saida]
MERGKQHRASLYHHISKVLDIKLDNTRETQSPQRGHAVRALNSGHTAVFKQADVLEGTAAELAPEYAPEWSIVTRGSTRTLLEHPIIHTKPPLSHEAKEHNGVI